MPYVIWSDMYSIRVPYIDNQHKKLLGIVNSFHESIQTGRDRNCVFETLNSLISYADVHFRDEERLMELSGCPAGQREEHKAAHERLVDDIFKLNNDFLQSAGPLICNVELFLNSWIIKHILLTDKQLEPFCTDCVNYRGRSAGSGAAP